VAAAAAGSDTWRNEMQMKQTAFINRNSQRIRQDSLRQHSSY